MALAGHVSRLRLSRGGCFGTLDSSSALAAHVRRIVGQHRRVRGYRAIEQRASRGGSLSDAASCDRRADNEVDGREFGF